MSTFKSNTRPCVCFLSSPKTTFESTLLAMPDPIPPPRTDSVTGFSEEDGAQYFGHVEPRWEAAAPGSGATDSHGSTQTLPRPSPARRDSVESVGTDGLNFFEDDDLVDAYPPALDFSSYTDWDYTKWDYPKWDIKDIKDKIRHSWVSSEQFKKFLVILTAILVAQGAMKLLDPNCVRTCPPEEQVVPCAVEPGLATQYTSVHPSQEAPRSWAQNSLKYMQSPMKVISGTMGDVLVKSFQVAERRKPSPLLRGTFSTDPWASPPRKKSFPQKGGPYTYPEKEWEQVIENSESTDWYGAQLKNIAVANMTSTLKQEIAGQKLSTWFGTPTQAGKLKRALDGLNKDNTSILK